MVDHVVDSFKVVSGGWVCAGYGALDSCADVRTCICGDVLSHSPLYGQQIVDLWRSWPFGALWFVAL